MQNIKHIKHLISQNKLVPLKLFANAKWRKTLGKVVVMTGTYDILTPYHLMFLRTGKYLEPKLTLVLALDSDETVRERKGDSRPVLPFDVRCATLSELDYVDVIVPDPNDNASLLRTIKPDIFVMSYSTKEELPEKRGSDYKIMEELGGKIVTMPQDSRFTFPSGKILCTSSILEEILSKQS